MSARRLLPISSFCRTGSGTTPPRSNAEAYYGGGIPWVKSGELREAEIVATEETVTDRALSETPLKLAPAGSLLVAMYGATVGRVGILKVPATTNQAVCHIVPDPQVADTRYMFHALQHLAPYFVSRGAGGAQPNISQGLIQQTEVYLPPLDEQRRIAAILDQADALRRKRREGLQSLTTLKWSIFRHLFGDPTSNPMDWPIMQISDLTASSQYGSSAKAGATGDFPMLRMGNLTYEGDWALADLKYVDLPAKDVEKFTVRGGDILFNRTNSPDLVGKTAVFRESEPYAFAGYLVRLRVNASAHPEYVSAYLNSSHGKATLRGMCKSIIGMANINARELGTICLPVPPIERQREFANQVEAIRAAEETQRAHLTQLDALIASLQHRAFRGEL